MPNGTTIQSSHTCNLLLTDLPHQARQAHILPELVHNSLISVGQLCDNQCSVTFTHDQVTVSPDAIIRYHVSDMILHIHSYASCLSISNARSRLGGLLFLGNKSPKQDMLNGSILNVASVIKNMVASAAESEAGACFHNAQSGESYPNQAGPHTTPDASLHSAS
jgi:hypothetical protein